LDSILGPTRAKSLGFFLSFIFLNNGFFYLIYKIKNRHKMDHNEKYENLMKILTSPIDIDGKKYLLTEELEKLYVSDNKRAATRIRKMMQMVKSAAQDIRDDVQDYRKSI
jgi:hypothetical protein